MSQKTLFDDEFERDMRCKRGDDAHGLNMRLIKRRLWDAASSSSGFTARELAEACKAIHSEIEVESYRKRCREMVVDGVFAEGPRRRCGYTGRAANTFRRQER